MTRVPASEDLRDSSFFVNWAERLPAFPRELLRKALVEYLDSDDTLRITFPDAMREFVSREEVRFEVMTYIRTFYEDGIQQWIASGDFVPGREAPRRFVMPRVIFQVAPSREKVH